MRNKLSVVLVTAVALLLGLLLLPGGAAAQEEGERYSESQQRFGLGIGAGIVRPDDEGEFYMTAALRIRLGGPDDDDKDRYGRKARRGKERGIIGYIEPEIGYWERSDNNDGLGDATDLLIGVNLLGVVPTRGADYFIGVGFGLHFFDAEFNSDNTISRSEENFGGNLQVGVDINVSDSLALFGVGRIDLVEGAIDDTQTKIYGGLRFKF